MCECVVLIWAIAVVVKGTGVFVCGWMKENFCVDPMFLKKKSF